MNELKRLRDKCKAYEIVSFDIFDTLLKRDVYAPGDVFSIVELQFDKSRETEKSDFALKRKAAEKAARDKSPYDEITLDEIYDNISFSIEERNVLKRMELHAEASVLHVNPDLAPLFNECVRLGKTVYIVSDMYLPIDFIEEVLNREGLTGYKKVYLSNEYRKTKRSGKLFETMCNEEGLDPAKVIHIGDSRYADYIGPKKAGIKGVHIPRRAANTLYMEDLCKSTDLTERCLYSFVNTRASAFQDRGIRLGYEVLGPIIYAYCCWLHNDKMAGKKESILWFAARDMYLFKEAYGRLFPEDKASYIYLSRKSLRPIYVNAVGDVTRSGDIYARGNYSLREIVRYMGYTLDDAQIVKGTDVDSKKYNIRTLEEYPEVVEALSSLTIATEDARRSNVGERYLEQQGLFTDNIIFADVGWHGTTQLLLQKIQERANCAGTITGRYIGCLDGTKEKIGDDRYKAFIFDEDDDSWFKKGIILFEAMILAPHGSTAGYKIDNNDVVPELSAPERPSSYIQSVQDGAMRFISDYSNSILSKTIAIENCHVSSAFEKMTCKPHKEEIEAIGDLEYDNFYCNKIAAPKTLRHYGLHHKELKKDLKYSPWRIGFLYRLLRVRLPYAKLYSYARKRQGKQT